MQHIERYRFFFINVLLICLIGCGFHLRGHQMSLSQHIPALEFNATPTDGLHQVVLKSLKASGIQMTPEFPAPILKVSREQWETRTLAYGPDSRPVRERLTLTSPFELVSSDGSNTLLKGKLSIERDRQLDPRLVLADSEEKQILQSEMRFDAAQQLLYQLAALNW